MRPLHWFRCRLAARQELRAWLDEQRRTHPPRPLCCPQPLVDHAGRVLPDPEHDLYERAGYGLRPMNSGPTAAAGHGGARTTPAGPPPVVARPSTSVGAGRLPHTPAPTGLDERWTWT